VEIKYNLKDATKLDFTLVTTKRKEIQNQLFLLDEKRKAEESKLQFYIGSDVPVSSVESEYKPFLFSLTSDSSTFNNHPNLMYYQTQQEILAKEKEVLIARTLPDITLGYVNQTLVGVHSVGGEDITYGSGDRFQAGQIGLEIPLFFGSIKRKSDALSMDIKQAEFLQEYERLNLTSVYTQYLLVYNGYLTSLKLYDEQLIPQIQIMEEQARLLLDTGEISMIEYLQTKQNCIDIELNYLQLFNEINQTVHQLNWFIQN
jgi:cobalt-zinc-cadmium resistance protein CzcA